jgi:hypothetical protein
MRVRRGYVSVARMDKRRHRGLVAGIFALALVTGFVGIFALWVNRQALDAKAGTEVSANMLDDPTIRNAVANYMVDELFSSVDVQGAIATRLPPQLSGLAGPASGGLRELANRQAPRLLASPRVQDAWRRANLKARVELLAIVKGKESGTVSTDGGVVTLDVRALIDELAQALGLESAVATARSKGVTLPESAGQIEILKSNELATAQDVVNLVRHLAVILPLLTFGLFGLAIFLAKGWRREALRGAGWSLITLGILVVLLRRVGGNEVVNSLVPSGTIRPAAHNAWEISTQMLRDIALATLFYGVVVVLAAWLAGPTRAAISVRRALAPSLRHNLAGSCAVLFGLFLLVLLWGPTPATRKPLGVLVLAILVVAGFEILRRQTTREFPDAQPGEAAARFREWLRTRRTPTATG